MNYSIRRSLVFAAALALAGFAGRFGYTATAEDTRDYIATRCLSITLTPKHVARVIDGDTYVVYALATPPEERVRVLGVDAPERDEQGYSEARDSTVAWLERGPFNFSACQRDSFGRYLAWTTRGTDSLHVYLIHHKLGTRTP